MAGALIMATKVKPAAFKVDHDNYNDDYLRGILRRVRVIAMVVPAGVGTGPAISR